VRPPLLAATCDEESAGVAEVTDGASEVGAPIWPPPLAAAWDWVSPGAAEGTKGAPPGAPRGEVGAGLLGPAAPPGAVVACSTVGGGASRVPATTALGPKGIVEVSSSFKKSRVAGSEGDVDISEKGNRDSSNTT